MDVRLLIVLTEPGVERDRRKSMGQRSALEPVVYVAPCSGTEFQAGLEF